MMRTKIQAILLFSIVPTLAFAQPQVMRTVDLITPPGSATFGVAHVEDLRDGNRRQFHVIVSTAEGDGEFTFDGRTIRLRDGYTIVSEILANTRAALVQRVTATTEAGSSESMILVQNRQTGETSAVGAERYALLLQGSHDVRIANQVLPLVTSAPHSQSGLGAKVEPMDCLVAVMGEISSLYFLVSSCTTGNLPACWGGIMGAITSLNSMMTNCYMFSFDDGTIGWL